MSNPIILEGATVTAASPVSVTPADFAFSFANDATRVVQPFIPDMTELERLQTSIEYEQHVSMLSRMLSTLARWDRNLSGNGSYTNWNGSGLFQFYNPGGGGNGQAIHAKGRPRLVDVRTLPFQKGVSRGFGRGRIGYIGRNNNSSVAKDLLGAAGLGVKSFQSGHDSNLLDIAIEAVKGNVGAENKPVEGTVTSENVQAVTKQVSASVMSQKDIVPEEERIDTIIIFFERRASSDNSKILYMDENGVYPEPIDTLDTYEVYQNGKLIRTFSKFRDK